MRHFLLLAGLLVLPFSGTAFADSPRQLILSRHMHKATTGQDPALSPCGLAQAQALATQLKNHPLPWLLHTPYQRTKQTAQALLQPGRQLVSYDPAQVDQLINLLNNKPGNVLVIGHSNTIPALAAKLTGQAVAPLSEQDYGRIYLLTEQQQHWQLQVTQLALPAPCLSAQTTQ